MTAWLKLKRRSQESSTIWEGKTPLHQLRYVVIDTELTSLDERSNRLLSVGAIAMDGVRIHVGEQFYRVVNPGTEIPTAGILIHKLRPNEVECGESPAKALADLQKFMADRVIVGHFVKIDLKILQKELSYSQHDLKNLAVDTARIHRWIMKNDPRGHDVSQLVEKSDLALLANLYDLEFREAHNALDDAFVTARLWQKMLHRLQAMNVQTLHQLLRIGKA